MMTQKRPLKLYNTLQIRDLEQLAIEGGSTGFQLMTRAGEAAFNTLRKRWPDAQTFVVFCGAGNNAGDGYVIAQLLLNAGLQVCVYAVGDCAGLKAEALQAYQAFINAQGTVHAYVANEAVVADVVVDALLGTGLSRSIQGLYADAIATINRSAKPVLAVDVPSGINADTGAVMGCAVHADCTVTFIGLKQGLCTGDAPDYCGELVVSDLKLAPALYAQMPHSLNQVAYKPLPKRSRCAHKGSNGHVLIIGGACGFSGAVMLAAQAALRIGSGLVSLATRPEHAAFINMTLPELMSHSVQQVEQLVLLLANASVVVIGPGLGQTAWSDALLNAVLDTTKPLIIDADALNLLAKKPLEPSAHPNWVLTPHPGEAARLLACSTTRVQQDRFAAVKMLQARYGGTVVLKGAGTLIANASSMSISSTGNPGMASGGMGDVLTGVIAGLCAQGMGMLDAVQQGVYLHGLAADKAAADAGERGLLASDLMPYLRQGVNA
ncbi:MAG: NAD(P)H-hydrate dehydratase [Methylococcales bacterium]|nr:NAD(P)H-hydrate dehydratase [Methylococcales bacterium]